MRRAQAIMLRRQEHDRLCNLDLQFMDKIKCFEAAHAQLVVICALVHPQPQQLHAQSVQPFTTHLKLSRQRQPLPPLLLLTWRGR